MYIYIYTERERDVYTYIYIYIICIYTHRERERDYIISLLPGARPRACGARARLRGSTASKMYYTVLCYNSMYYGILYYTMYCVRACARHACVRPQARAAGARITQLLRTARARSYRCARARARGMRQAFRITR